MLNGFPDNFRMDDDDVINEFRKKQANFDLEEKQNEISNSRSLFIGALAGLAMAAIVSWFVLAPQYHNEEQEEIPLIRRSQEEVKVQPAEPGRIAISNQEQTVYNILERKSENNEQTNVLPPPEQPNSEVIEALVEERAAQTEDIKKDETTVESLITNQAMNSVVEEQVTSNVTPKNNENTKVEETQTKSDEQEKNVSNIKTQPVKEEKIISKVQQNQPIKKENTVVQGNWQIQLISSTNKNAVEKAWSNLTAKYKILSDLPYEVSSADLGVKGVYYRLKAGNFANKSEASTLCGKIKAAGGSCFVTRKE